MEAFWISWNDWEPTSLTSLHCCAWSLERDEAAQLSLNGLGFIFPDYLLRGLACWCRGMDLALAHPNNSDAVKRSWLPTLIRLRHPWQHLRWHGPWAPGSWRQLPWLTRLGSLWLGWPRQWWPCHLSSFQRSTLLPRYVRFSTNMWPNIFLHSHCN